MNQEPIKLPDARERVEKSAMTEAAGSAARAAKREQDGYEVNDVKLAINTLIWMHAPETTTLKDAEVISLEILSMILSGKPQNEKVQPPRI